MSWSEEERQSLRASVYNEYFSKLEDSNKAYPCCSQEQLAISRKAMLAQGKPPRYSGICKNLSADERQKRIEQGIKPTLRFVVENDEVIEFEDLVKGPQKFLGSDIGILLFAEQMDLRLLCL